MGDNLQETKTQGAHPGAHRGIDYKWIVLSVTTIGSLMAAIDSTIVTLALPDMMVKLHADLIEMTWVIMAYILISTVLLLTFGRVADMFGRVRMYNLGFIVFTVGSALCGLSQNADQLILFRLVQGSGAALMMVNSPAIITEVFPVNERGRALGINGITWALGGIAGPILGGFILAAASWRWIFYINVPIGIIGTLWGYRALHETSISKRGERFDPIGAATFSAGLVALLVALTLGIQYSWTSLPIVSLFALFIVMSIAFFAWERRAAHPVLDLSLFQNRVYNFSVLSAMLQSLAMFAVDFLIIYYLQAVRGYSPLTAALLLIPLPLVSAIVAVERHPGRPYRRADPCHAGGAAAGGCAGVVHHLAFSGDAVLAARRGPGVNGPGRRAVLVTEYQRGDRRHAQGAAWHCLGHAGHPAANGNGNQFCRGAGSGGGEPAGERGRGAVCRYQHLARLTDGAGLCHRNPERLCGFRNALPGGGGLFAGARQREPAGASAVVTDHRPSVQNANQPEFLAGFV